MAPAKGLCMLDKHMKYLRPHLMGLFDVDAAYYGADLVTPEKIPDHRKYAERDITKILAGNLDTWEEVVRVSKNSVGSSTRK